MQKRSLPETNVPMPSPKRIKRETRVAILGRPGCGKSSLINALLGSKILPTPGLALHSALCPVEVVHADRDDCLVSVNVRQGAPMAAQVSFSTPANARMHIQEQSQCRDVESVVVSTRFARAPPSDHAFTLIEIPGIGSPDFPLERIVQLASQCHILVWCNRYDDYFEEGLMSFSRALIAKSPALFNSMSFVITKFDCCTNQPAFRSAFSVCFFLFLGFFEKKFKT